MSKWHDTISDYVTFMKDSGQVPQVLCSVSEETFDMLSKICSAKSYTEGTQYNAKEYDALMIEDGGLPHREFCPQVETVIFTSSEKGNSSSFENTFRARKFYESHHIEADNGGVIIKSKNSDLINKITNPTATVPNPEPEARIEEEVTTTQPPTETKSDWLNRWSN